jgi:DNA polymerase (family X)
MNRIALHVACSWAEKIRDLLVPFCVEKMVDGSLVPGVVIAGSIRRARPDAGDIDLVIETKPGMRTDLEQFVLARATKILSGPCELRVRLKNNFQLDCYFARPAEQPDLWAKPIPSNWGSVLLCRTGSAQHNVWLCQQAKQVGMQWKTSIGLCKLSPETGDVVEVVAGETEESIFDALGIPWIPPVQRERQETGAHAGLNIS